MSQIQNFLSLTASVLRPQTLCSDSSERSRFVRAALEERAHATAELGIILSSVLNLVSLVADIFIIGTPFLYRLFLAQHLVTLGFTFIHLKYLKQKGITPISLVPLYQFLLISVYAYAVYFVSAGFSVIPNAIPTAWVGYTSLSSMILILVPWNGNGVFVLAFLFAAFGFGVTAVTKIGYEISIVSFLCICMAAYLQRFLIYRVVVVTQTEFKSQQLAVKLERARAERDMELAQEIQDSMRVREAMNIGPFRVEFMFRRKSIVGGDWYAVRADEQGEIYILIVDAAGSGVQAALVLHAIQSLWAAALEEGLFIPSKWLGTVNNALVTLGRREPQSVTAGILKVTGESLTYWNAGHVPCFVATGLDADVVIKSISGKGTILGVQRDITIVPAHFDLTKGVRQRVLLATDGVFPSAFTVSKRKIAKLLVDIGHLQHKVLDEVASTDDDRTLVVLDNQKQAKADLAS